MQILMSISVIKKLINRLNTYIIPLHTTPRTTIIYVTEITLFTNNKKTAKIPPT